MIDGRVGRGGEFWGLVEGVFWGLGVVRLWVLGLEGVISLVR